MPLNIRYSNLVGYWPLNDIMPRLNINNLIFQDYSSYRRHGIGIDTNADSEIRSEYLLSYPPQT
jgi:hypothetical protein